jgi:hypothetical protein
LEAVGQCSFGCGGRYRFYARAYPRRRSEADLGASIFTFALVVGLVLGLLCFKFASKKTIIVNGRYFVKGRLLPKAAAYIKEHQISEALYLKGSAYQPDDVWTPDSIGKNTATLLALFSAISFFLAFGMLGALDLAPELNPKPENWFLKYLPWVLLIVAVGIAILFACLWLYAPRTTVLSQSPPSRLCWSASLGPVWHV